MHYTQDECYYLLDAEPDAVVYLGVQTGVDRDAMLADLRAATDGEHPFPAENYVNVFPARKHDHFLIPAGTVHCSGAVDGARDLRDAVHLHVQALGLGPAGLDGVPRPVHIDHGERDIRWDRDTE